MDPEAQIHTGTEPGFLGLPPEVRNMIYRLLLVASKPLGNKTRDPYPDKWEKYPHKRFVSKMTDAGSSPVWARFGKYRLQPAILRVCQLVYREASPVLNGENTFGIFINGYPYNEDEDDYDDDELPIKKEHREGFLDQHEGITEIMDFYLDVDSESFEQNPNLSWSGVQKDDSIIKKLQRLEIVVLHADVLGVKVHVKTLCNSVLRKMPELKHVCIHLLDDKPEVNHTTLGPFRILNSMRSVVFHGVPPPFAERLREQMLGNRSYEDLEAMYHMLDDYVTSLNGSLEDLKAACMAMVAWDVQAFKELRSKILEDGKSRMERALRHMFDYDLDSEDDDDETIDGESEDEDDGESEEADGESEEDHAGKIKEDGHGKLAEDHHRAT